MKPGLLSAIASCSLLIAGCPGKPEAETEDNVETQEEASTTAARSSDPAATPSAKGPYDDYPLHGLVTGLQLRVRKRPNRDAEVVGWLRIGSRVRAKRLARRSEGCGSGWHAVHPAGFVCKGQGLTLGRSPPESEVAAPPPNREAALPYTYWYVKEALTPEYHRLPSRGEQRAADVFAARYQALREDDPDRAEKLMAGELESEPKKPAVVHRYLDRGFFVAGVGVEFRAQRRFVRTVRSRYVPHVRLIERTGSAFLGVELTEEDTLPIVWARRTAPMRIRRDRDDGTRFVKDMELEPLPRHGRVDSWRETVNVDGAEYHRLETEAGDRFVREWFLSVAKTVQRPRRISAKAHWVHVSLRQQTLVLYEGDEPRFATLVSTGQTGFETPTGLFSIHKKYVADTMAGIGDGNDDRYSIEDVPWAQYFDRSIALHGAFWHTRFGLERSHGCVNLSPGDARTVFSFLDPQVPEGWLGVQAGAGSPFRASHVWVTQR